MKNFFAVFVLLVMAVMGWIGYHSLSNMSVATAPIETPRQVVESFYEVYLESIGDRSTGEFHNPLVEKSYRQMPQLSGTLVEKVDAELEVSEHIAFDPFLCAQSIPSGVTVTDVTTDDKQASATVVTDFADHQFTVELEQMDTIWTIIDIHCD